MKVVEQSQISPPPNSVPESTLPLTFFDIVFLPLPPVQRCFFYHLPRSTSHIIQSHVPNLKSSLSLTLQNFYPLAAKLRASPHSDEHFELHYTKNDSVAFTVAESDDDFLDLTGNHPRELSRLHRLFPQLSDNADTGKSLLAIQLTVFHNHGICIGLSFNHVACDGISFNHFVKSWAAACRSDTCSIPPPPSFEYRTTLTSHHDFYSIINRIKQNLKPHAENSESSNLNKNKNSTEFSYATFKLTSQHIVRLKQLVNQYSSFHCSTFVVTSAYLWVCLVKLRKGAADDQMVHFPMAVDWRERLQPRVPPTYFGNCILWPVVTLKVCDITKDDGLVAASKAIVKCIEELKQGIGKLFEVIEEVASDGWTKPAITIAGSPRLKVYEADFGWGRPVKVEIGHIKNAGVGLSESREDSGGVEFGLVLSKQEMEKFTAIFNEGLQLL